jgi:hypothetical protein
VMMVTSRRVSRTATTTCTQTISLVVTSVLISHSQIIALRLTLQLVKLRTVSPMRTVADVRYRTPQLGYFLPVLAVVHYPPEEGHPSAVNQVFGKFLYRFVP